MKSNKVIHHTGRDGAVYSDVETEIENLRTASSSATSSIASLTASMTLALNSYLSGFVNGALAASVSGNALTISVKTAAGTDPSASDPVYLVFRNVTDATGTPTALTLSSALSLTISSGSTMGTTSSVAFRLWVVVFNDGGTARLGAINCYTSTGIVALADGIASSTAESGSGAADSAGVIYTGTAATAKAVKVLGFLEWSSGLGTAGTWSSGPLKIQLAGPGSKLPGDTIQQVYASTGALTSSATTTPADNSIPQSTEGVEVITVTLTPQGAANVLYVDANLFGGTSAGTTNTVVAHVHRDSIADAKAAIYAVQGGSATGEPMPMALFYAEVAGSVSNTTWKLRAGASAATVNVNGAAGARVLGGVANTFISVREIMG